MEWGGWVVESWTSARGVTTVDQLPVFALLARRRVKHAGARNSVRLPELHEGAQPDQAQAWCALRARGRQID